jgi:NADP-dependent 3-hydroxy acid dehydrogenase YdfG
MSATVAIVAGRGGPLGHATAVALAAGGLTVVAVGRTEHALSDLPEDMDRMTSCAVTRVTISASLTGTRQPVLHRVEPAPDRSARRPPSQRRTIKALRAA